jgi:hypothetical protein
MDRPRQAVVLIHGIGEQRPMATLHSFVNWLLGDCADDGHGKPGRRENYYSKPDQIGDSFELRRIKLKRLKSEVDPQHEGLNEDWPPTDFYEYYWAHRMQGTTVSHVLRWVQRLGVSVWRDRADVPELGWLLRPGCRGPMSLVLLVVLLAVAGLAVAGPVLKAWFASLGVAFVLVVLSKLWKAIAGGVLLDVVGDAARYLDVHPANVACRYEILRGGVQMLRKLHDMRDERGDRARCRYGRIVLIGHSLGSVIAYDIAKHYWSEVNGHLPIDAMTEEQLDAAARFAPDGKSSSSGSADDFRRCQARAWQSINAVQWYEKVQERHESPPKRWLISDLITLGSPLAYARFLLADGRCDFNRKVRLRELPTCPPDRSTTVHPGYYTVPLSAEAEPIGEDYQILHHAAHFALTRWTNIHLANDPVGYRLDCLGRGVEEVSAGDVGEPSMFRAHTSYWRPETRMPLWRMKIHRVMLAILKERDVYAFRNNSLS